MSQPFLPRLLIGGTKVLFGREGETDVVRIDYGGGAWFAAEIDDVAAVAVGPPWTWVVVGPHGRSANISASLDCGVLLRLRRESCWWVAIEAAHFERRVTIWIQAPGCPAETHVMSLESVGFLDDV